MAEGLTAAQPSKKEEASGCGLAAFENSPSWTSASSIVVLLRRLYYTTPQFGRLSTSTTVQGTQEASKQKQQQQHNDRPARRTVGRNSRRCSNSLNSKGWGRIFKLLGVLFLIKLGRYIYFASILKLIEGMPTIANLPNTHIIA